MLERISEPISNIILRQITSVTEIDIINFQNESNLLKSKIPGVNYNFNYNLVQLSISYLLPSLTAKPFQEYKLTDTEVSKRAADVEFARNYNELNGFASKLTLNVTQISSGVKDVIGEILLYGHPVSLQMPLLQYLGSPIMNDGIKLSVKLSHYRAGDKAIICAGYNGNLNYTLDTGNQSHVFL